MYMGMQAGVVNQMINCPLCKDKMGVVTLTPYLGDWRDGKQDWRESEYTEKYLRELVIKTLVLRLK